MTDRSAFPRREGSWAAVVVLGMVVGGCSASASDAEDWGSAEAKTLTTVEGDYGFETVVVDGVALVVTRVESNMVSLRAVDAKSGEEYWDAGDEFRSHPSLTSEAVVAVTKSNEVVVKDIASGETRFDPVRVAEDGGAFAVNSDTALVSGWDGRSDEVAAIDLNDGEVKWSWKDGDGKALEPAGSDGDGEVWANAPSDSLPATPPSDMALDGLHLAADSPIVYIGESFQQADDDKIAAVDVDSGKKLWTQDAPTGASSSPIQQIDDTIVSKAGHVGTSCKRTLWRTDAKSGDTSTNTLYRTVRDPKTDKWTCGLDEDGIAVTGDGIYGQNKNHHPTVLDPATGKTVWTAPDAGEPLTLADGIAVYRSWGKNGTATVHAVDLSENKELWDAPAAQGLKHAVAHEGQLLLVEKSRTRVRDLRTGTAQWEYPDAQPIAADDHLVFDVTTDDKHTITSTTTDGKGLAGKLRTRTATFVTAQDLKTADARAHC